MAKKVRFPLEMANGVQAKSIEELREHFELNKVLEYYKIGKLFNWLDAYYYAEEAEKIKSLNPKANDFVKQLCAALGVELPSEDVNYEVIAERAERLERLKQYTSDEKILAMVDAVAFDQEELYDRLDEGCETIYLCGENISVPSGAKGREIVDLLKKEELYHDKFEVMKIFDANDVKVEFTGVKFNKGEETITLSFFVENDREETIVIDVADCCVNKEWAIINGKEMGSFYSIESVEAKSSMNIEVLLKGMTISYENIEHIWFILNIGPEEEEESDWYYRSDKVGIDCNTRTGQLSVGIYDGRGMSVERHILSGNGHGKNLLSITFKRLQFDHEKQELEIVFEYSDMEMHVVQSWLKNIIVNGISYESKVFMEMPEPDFAFTEVCVLVPEVDGILYKDIETIEFELEIDDTDGVKLYDSSRLKILCDTEKETFKDIELRENIIRPILDEHSTTIEFRGAEFDDKEKIVALYFKTSNRWSFSVEVWLKNVVVNGMRYLSEFMFDEVEGEEESSIRIRLDGIPIPYEDIREVEFEVEVRYGLNVRSKRVRILVGGPDSLGTFCETLHSGYEVEYFREEE